jgi:hypothetical protein
VEKSNFKYKIGDRNGDFILAKRELVRNKWQETWLLDPTDTLTPDADKNEAYQKMASNALSPYTSPDDATTELTAAQYSIIQTEDDLLLTLGATVSTNFRYANVASKYTFNTSEYSNITDITCIWKGNRSPSTTPDVEKLQVYKATLWEDWLTVLPIPNTKYTKSLGNGSAYFYSSTWIRFGVYQTRMKTEEDPTLSIGHKIDYVALQITYSVVVAVKAGLSPAQILAILEET